MYPLGLCLLPDPFLLSEALFITLVFEPLLSYILDHYGPVRLYCTYMYKVPEEGIVFPF